jgi:predicted MPP superfamily phosphohydrolase
MAQPIQSGVGGPGRSGAGKGGWLRRPDPLQPDAISGRQQRRVSHPPRASGEASQRVSRRKFLRWALGVPLATAAAAAGGAGYAYGIEPDWLAIEQVTVRVPDLPPALDGLRIAHLSDLHWGPYTGQREVRAAVQAANALAPDLSVLSGDYVLYSAGYAEPCAAELAALRAPLGVFAIPGNHDYWTDIDVVTAELRRTRLPVLRNESHRLEIDGSPLWLAGVDDVWEQHDDLAAALRGIPRDEPVLLLAHEPDFADEAARAPKRIFLQLSGHSHGGQVNLPVLGRPILPWLGQKYPAGLQVVPGSSLQVYTSRGIGVIAPPLRFNCRPEVALLTITASE